MSNHFWKGNNTSKIQVAYSGNHQALQFFYIEIDPFTGKRKFAAPIEMVEHKVSEPIKPFFEVKDGNEGILQGMFDGLWRMGIRPTDLGTIDSVLTAKDQHLDDLRKVAFHALGIGVPHVPDRK